MMLMVGAAATLTRVEHTKWVSGIIIIMALIGIKTCHVISRAELFC